MTYLLYMVVCFILMWFCSKNNIELPLDDTTMLIIAILTAGEVISWRCKK